MSGKKFLRLPWWEYVVIGILAALCVLPILADAYGGMTCGASDEEMQMYLNPRMAPEATGLLKVEQNGRIKAAIYEHKSMGLMITVFERRLFGLRWKQVGMDGLDNTGLHSTGAWSSGGNCHVVIYGDNRDGLVYGYTLTDCPEVARDGLESDFILDIYILDFKGIDAYPMDLEQYFHQ